MVMKNLTDLVLVYRSPDSKLSTTTVDRHTRGADRNSHGHVYGVTPSLRERRVRHNRRVAAATVVRQDHRSGTVHRGTQTTVTESCIDSPSERGGSDAVIAHTDRGAITAQPESKRGLGVARGSCGKRSNESSSKSSVVHGELL